MREAGFQADFERILSNNEGIEHTFIRRFLYIRKRNLLF